MSHPIDLLGRPPIRKNTPIEPAGYRRFRALDTGAQRKVLVPKLGTYSGGGEQSAYDRINMPAEPWLTGEGEGA